VKISVKLLVSRLLGSKMEEIPGVVQEEISIPVWRGFPQSLQQVER
jgi:hypothetical protein